METLLTVGKRGDLLMPRNLPERSKSVPAAKAKKTKAQLSERQTSVILQNVLDEHLLALEHGMHVRELHLVDAERVTDRGRAHLKKLTHLEWLNLDAVTLGDSWLSSLQGADSLGGLQISRARQSLTRAGLQSLQNLKQLQYLAIEETAVDDHGAIAIGELKNLRSLRLCSTNLTDSGLKQLEKLTNLQSLHITDSFVTATGVARLQQALPECRITYSSYASPLSLTEGRWRQVPQVPHTGVPRYLNPRWPHIGEPRFVDTL